MTQEERRRMATEMSANLTENILPYWIEKMTDPRGGYYGRIDGNEVLHTDAPKGAIMHARILWTMAAAYNATKDGRYLRAAKHAYEYILRYFIDREFGGIYQSVDWEGRPLDTKKQFYAIAFVIYGMAEYYMATKNNDVLNEAISLFHIIEKYSRDRELGGYIEAKNRDWSEAGDMRLSDKDANACKTMNTHLHILEAYSALYRIWHDERLKEALESLIEIFSDKITDKKTHHLGLFFDRNWKRQDGEISYGHDIEASWLLLEAAEALGNEETVEKVKKLTRKIADAALEGRCTDGSIVYERHKSGSYDNEKHWWVQAEAVVGQLYLWKYHKIAGQDDSARQTWDYIKNNLLDTVNGEWYWSILPAGEVNRKDDKAGYWKCPYHNGRMIMESCRLLTDD